MSLVSISEAARLTGKDRRTIQRHIASGKLSKSSDGCGIDTSELIRAYGAIITLPNAQFASSGTEAAMSQKTTPTASAPDYEKEALKAEVENLKTLLASKQEHIDSLKQAMLLLELL